MLHDFKFPHSKYCSEIAEIRSASHDEVIVHSKHKPIDKIVNSFKIDILWNNFVLFIEFVCF